MRRSRLERSALAGSRRRRRHREAGRHAVRTWRGRSERRSGLVDCSRISWSQEAAPLARERRDTSRMYRRCAASSVVDDDSRGRCASADITPIRSVIPSLIARRARLAAAARLRPWRARSEYTRALRRRPAGGPRCRCRSRHCAPCRPPTRPCRRREVRASSAASRPKRRLLRASADRQPAPRLRHCRARRRARADVRRAGRAAATPRAIGNW